MHAQENDPTGADPIEPKHETIPATGVRALTSDTFSINDTIGGVRGLIESMAPGLVFVVVYVITRDLMAPLVSSLAVAVLAVIVRLIQRTPLTQAFGGLLGVVIGVFWAWKSGDATQYFAWGLVTNGAYLAVMLASVLVRWPVVGLVVEGLRAGFGLSALETNVEDARARADARATAKAIAAADAALASIDGSASAGADAPAEPGAFKAWAAVWRGNPGLMRRYISATWLWIGMFGLRLAVQIPLFLNSEVGWLGTARLVMGIPLWGLVLWATWVLVRPREELASPTEMSPAP